ncbi:MAG: hypothetical protein ACKPJD_22250, partial [Planctomycetaceae bacterium]
LGTTGVILGAWYLLTAVQKVFFGKLREPHHDGHGDHDTEDMNAREFLALFPLAALCLFIGIRPAPLIDIIRPDVELVVDRIANISAGPVPGAPVQPAENTAEPVEAAL